MKSLLAGYISGSSVDLARVRLKEGKVELFDQANFPSRKYSDLDTVLDLYLNKKRHTIDIACFGVAGPVIGGEVVTTNLPWHIKGSSIENQFGVSKVTLVNDIIATAHGLTHLMPESFYEINEGTISDGSNVGLIAAGSGLGEALIVKSGKKTFPYASEGGHADFAPASQIEVELWQYLYSALEHVETEDVVSLRGLESIYSFLVETQGFKASDWFKQSSDRPLMIIEKALAEEDETAVKALEIMIDCYASEAANLALNGMTLGGIYIGGLIAPRILTAMDHGKFMNRFVKSGKMGAILEKIPVRVIIEEKTALLGAAGLTASL